MWRKAIHQRPAMRPPIVGPVDDPLAVRPACVQSGPFRFGPVNDPPGKPPSCGRAVGAERSTHELARGSGSLDYVDVAASDTAVVRRTSEGRLPSRRVVYRPGITTRIVRAAGTVLALAMIALAPARLPAQSTPPALSPAAAQTPAALAPYLLAADDALSITCVNYANLTTNVVVLPDGKIAVPLIGQVSVVGKTVQEVQDTLQKAWAEYVIEPAVTVAVTTKRKENVLFYGFVQREGTVDYKPALHIVEALADAGGPMLNGDLLHVTVTHKTGLSQTLDLSHPENKRGTEVDVLLVPGDVVFIPERRTQVSVVGEVQRPGSIDYKENMTVLDALGEAGGVKETADLFNSTLTHAGTEKPLDLDRLLRHGDMTVNLELGAGDRILVPEIRNRVYVFGAVGHPGYYNFKPADRVLDALNGASGPTQQANLGRVNVIRINKAKNTATLQRVDIAAVLKKADMKGNVELEAGDVLYVPEKKRALGLPDIIGALTGLSFLDTGARIFTHGLGN